LDKFLQLSRLVKRRAVAQALCAAGRVRLNGTNAKSSASVQPGDVITVTQGDRRLMAKILALPTTSQSSADLVEILGRIKVPELVLEPETPDPKASPMTHPPTSGGIVARRIKPPSPRRHVQD
jgi:ribosomal 50S subunit-recycling heat shock protein